MTAPFCDFLGVTVPEELWDGLRADVTPVLDAVGMAVEVDDSRSVLWRSPDAHGTVKASKVGRVWSLGCSGAVCAGLRLAGLFAEYLSVIGERPHRVTRLDASVDLVEDAAPVVQVLTDRGRAGGLSLTRKGIQPKDVLAITGVRLDGAVTGTVYLGGRRADVRMVVYDKQHERQSRGLPDSGPLTRYELRLKSGAGATLRDAADPSAVFWHYASPDFLPAPPDAPVWSAHGTGFDITRVPPLSPAERLRRRVQSSAEVAALVALAGEVGPYGLSFLVSELRRLSGDQVWAEPTGTALPTLCGHDDCLVAATPAHTGSDAHRA